MRINITTSENNGQVTIRLTHTKAWKDKSFIPGTKVYIDVAGNIVKVQFNRHGVMPTVEQIMNIAGSRSEKERFQLTRAMFCIHAGL